VGATLRIDGAIADSIYNVVVQFIVDAKYDRTPCAEAGARVPEGRASIHADVAVIHVEVYPEAVVRLVAY
jgi:hypothetical protein